MLPKDSRDWSPELRIALEAIGVALRGRVPTIELLSALAPEYCDAVPDHMVKAIHKPKGELAPNKAFFRIVISGNRVDGAWNLTTGQLRDALNAACPSFEIRLS